MTDDMQGPKDEYLHHYVASKVEARRIYQSTRFEEIAAKYWQLLRQDKLADTSKVTLSKAQYVGFMKRVYRVLLALYRADEMEKEIEEEWLMDSAGCSELSLHLFTKLLFRIVHQWATHIDLDEYIEFLEKLFERITIRKAVRAKDYKEMLCYPTIITEIVPDTKDGEDPWAPNTSSAESALWDPCLSDEEERPGFDYQFIEDEGSMTVRKHKKRTPPPNANEEEGMGEQPPAFLVKEALNFRETPVYYQNSGDYRPHSNDMVTYVLAEEHDILPIGYPTEQFLTWLKNDVYSKLEQSKKERKEAIARMKKEALSKGGTVDDTRGLKREEDPGVVKAVGNFLELPYDLITSTAKTRTRAKIKIVDLLYNSMRAAIKDIQQISLRQEMLHPRQQLRSGSVQHKGSVGGNEPSTEINKFGYNPALSRRARFKLVPIFSKKGKPEYININFMYQHQDYEAAYRCDVEKTENANKLAIKPSEEVHNEYDFVPFETSYKMMRQIMLAKKFETIYTDILQGDESDLKRIDKLVEKEEIRKKKCRLQETLSTKAVAETYEEKHIIKAMMGPFFKSISKQGLKEDEFVTCAQQDLIDFASRPAAKVLLLGKPRSGKTTLGKMLAQRLDLVHINIQNWMDKLLLKIQKHKEEEEENPPELEEGQEPPKWLTDLEESIYNKLLSGGGPNHQENIAILREEMSSPMALTKGYVLDLNFYKGADHWKDIIRNENLIGQPDANGNPAEFSHVIELELDDDEVKLRAKSMLMDGADGVVYSGHEIRERNKPKPVQLDEEGNPIEEEAEEDPDKPKPLIVSEMIKRVEDTEAFLQVELENYAEEKKQQIDDFIVRLHNHQYIKLDAAGQTPEELADSAEYVLRPDETVPLRPIAIQPENEAGDFKALITDPMKEEVPEGTLPRTYGLWQQTDPVALYNGKVLPGQAGFGIAYANNMFAFASEENRDAFLKEPKKYLVKAPYMPKSYRAMMVGPKGIGVHTQAEKLQSQYGWKIVDYQKIVREKLAIILKESEGIQKEDHLPNNVEEGNSRIGLSWTEIEDIKSGKPFPSWKFIPWVLDFLGHRLMKRPPPPVEPEAEVNPEELEGEELDNYNKAQKKKEQEQAQKKKEEEELAKAKAARAEKRKQQLEEGVPPEEIEESPEEKPEDLSIDDLVLHCEEDQPAPFVGGFILLGFPQTEVHMTKLKEHGIEFDRILSLADQREEDVGKEVIERMAANNLHYDWEGEVAKVTKVLDMTKEFLGDDAEKVLDINGIGTIDEVFIRIRAAIDPFFLRVDNPDDVRTSAELDEEAKRLPKGDFGDYCPVTYIKDNWLVKGSQEFEATVYGKTYWFAGEKEQEDFKFNPARFLTGFGGAQALPLTPPPPKIMILGCKGSGVTTQQQMLAKKFKLDTLNLREEFLDKFISEREIRKRRRLLDRGFKPPPPPEDEEEEGAEVPPDPEIEEDPEEFDKEQHERDLVRMIADCSKGLIIDGTWQGGWPEQLEKDGKVLLKEFAPPASKEDGAAYAQFLVDSRRVPEVIVILKCTEENSLKRMIDEDGIKKKYDDLMEKRAQEFEIKRNKDREEKLKELDDALAAAREEEEKTPEDLEALKKENEEAMVEWEKARDEEDKAADEDDPERPNLEEMLEAEKAVIRTQLEADDAFLTSFVEACAEKNIQVIDNLKTDQSAQFAFVKLLDKLKDRIQMRPDLIEREQVRALEPNELKFYEQSYTYQQSKFGRNSPLSLFNPVKTRDHAVLYRERLYYLSDAEEKELFMAEPSKYTLNVESIPLDVVTKPRVAILGLPMSGKSTLAAQIAKDTGAVHIQLGEVIEAAVERDSVQGEKIRQQLKTEGRGLDDGLLIGILAKRLKAKDCLLNGWIIEDFPRTRQQAMLMARNGINPANVFHLRIAHQEVFRRTEPLVDSDFGAHRTILSKRLRYLHTNTPQVLGFYQRLFDSLTELDGVKSKWFLHDTAMAAIEANMRARQLFSRSQCFPKGHPQGHRPSEINDLNIDRCILKASVSQFKYFCPVTWKNTKQLFKCTHNQELCVFYDHMFYYFKGQVEKEMFISNPKRFTNNIIFSSSKGIPFRIAHHKAAEIVAQEKAITGHCPVTLAEEGRVVKGDNLLTVQYKDNKFCFESETKLQKFLVMPAKYHKAQLPVRMPPHDDPVSLYALQGGLESTAFMEQALGSVVTRGLREVSENRLKHPHMSVKETMLKLFAIFLKAENPANSAYLKEKYLGKMKLFIERCEIAEDLSDLKEERDKKIKKDKWPEFKDKYYHELGAKYDEVLKQTSKEKQNGFQSYMK